MLTYRKAYVLLPGLITMLVALAACLPWGAPAPVAYALPLFTMAVIFYWTLNRRDLLPSPLVFALGVFTDLATAGPLGYWALNFLITLAIASYGPDRFGDRRDNVTAISLFAAAVVMVSVIGWALSSLFFLRPMPVRSLIMSSALAMLAYPLIAYLLSPLDRLTGYGLHGLRLRKDDYA